LVLLVVAPSLFAPGDAARGTIEVRSPNGEDYFTYVIPVQ